MENASIQSFHVAKAQRTNAPIPDLYIYIDGRVPEFYGEPHVKDYVEEARDWFQEQARFIAQGLHTSLPGGTWDALLVAMLVKHVSILNVSHPIPDSWYDGPLHKNPVKHEYSDIVETVWASVRGIDTLYDKYPHMTETQLWRNMVQTCDLDRDDLIAALSAASILLSRVPRQRRRATFTR